MEQKETKLYLVSVRTESECDRETHERVCIFPTRDIAEAYINREAHEFQREHYDEFATGKYQVDTNVPGYFEASSEYGEDVYQWALTVVPMSDNEVCVKTAYIY